MSDHIRVWRRLLEPLRGTLFHPQWLVLRTKKSLVAWVIGEAGDSVLDVGCGDGAMRRAISPNAGYVAMDYPATVSLGYGGIADLYGDASRLPLAAASFDTVLFLDVLEHLRYPREAVLEAARVLRPGGKCLVHVPFLYPLHDEPHDYQRWTRHGLEALFGDAGLDVLEVTETTVPIESSAALLSMALARGVVAAFERRSWAMLMCPFALILIPMTNFVGWFMGMGGGHSGFMTFSYRMLVVKRCDVEQAPADGE